MLLKGFDDFSVIAEGGMAVVYRATQTSLGRPVAIKLLKAGLLDNDSAKAMFERESMIIARLDHPNIIRVIDRGSTAYGMPYFVMDYIEGKTLRERMQAGDLRVQEKMRILIQVAKALAYAHKNNIIHRDIKPSNIIIDYEGNARVVDFGIALLGTESNADASGMTAGTLGYMAPEQREGNSFATAASDIYSLGVLMHLMLAGIMPRPGGPSPSHYNSSLPAAIDLLITSCLSPQSAHRPPAELVVSELVSATNGEHLTRQELDSAQEAFNDPKEKFRLLDIIRETPYSAVYLYENRGQNQLLVLKKRIGNFNGFQQAETLFKSPHPNIVAIKGVTRNDRIFIVIMEYLAGGSLQERMARTATLREFHIIAEQICDAMIYAHSLKIVHGNLRPRNILFDQGGRIKLTDFGMERHYQEGGKEEWYSVSNEPISVKGDVYSAGAIFYQMLTGAVPRFKQNVLVSNETFETLPDTLKHMLSSMLSRNPAKRAPNFHWVRQLLAERPAPPPPLPLAEVEPERRQPAVPPPPPRSWKPWMTWATVAFVTVTAATLAGLVTLN